MIIKELLDSEYLIFFFPRNIIVFSINIFLLSQKYSYCNETYFNVQNYTIEYYKIIITLIREGGLMALDNMLWSGEVINPKDKNSIMLNKTAKFINNDERVFNTLLPIRDGLMVCYKK